MRSKFTVFTWLIFTHTILFAQLNTQELVLQNFHSGYQITDMAVTADGTACVTIGDDNQMLFFDVNTRKVYHRTRFPSQVHASHVAIDSATRQVITLENHAGNAMLIYRKLINGEFSGTINLQQILDSLRLTGIDEFMMAVNQEENTLLLLAKGTTDHFLLFALHTGQLYSAVKCPYAGKINNFLSEDKKILVLSSPGLLREINTENNHIDTIWKAADANEGAANFAAGGSFVWILTDKHMRLLDRSTWTVKEVFPLAEPQERFPHSRHHPLMADEDGNAWYYNRDGQQLYRFTDKGPQLVEDAPKAYISHIFGLASQKKYLFIANNEQLSIVDAGLQKQIFSISNHWQSLSDWHFSQPGIAMVTADRDNVFLKADLTRAFITRQELPAYIQGPQHQLIELPLTKQKAINNGISVKLIDAATGRLNMQLHNPQGKIYTEYSNQREQGSLRGFKNICISADETVMVSVKPLSCTVLVWDLAKKEFLKEIDLSPQTPDNSQYIDHLVLHPGGKYIYAETTAANMGNTEAIIAELPTGRIILRESLLNGYGFHGAFFPENNMVLIPGKLFNESRLYNISSGVSIQLPALKNPVVSRNEKEVYYVKADSLYIYDLVAGKIVALGEHHQAENLFLDEKTGFLVSTDRNKMTKIWDTFKRSLLFTLIIEVPENPAQDPSYIFITPDNYYSGGGNISQFFTLRTKDHNLSFEQFDRLYNRPDKIISAAGKANPKLIAQLQTIAARREKSFAAPSENFTAVITNKNSFPVLTSAKEIMLRFTSVGAPSIAAYQVWINGVPLFYTENVIKGKPYTQLQVEEKIMLTEKTNRVEVAFWDKAGKESLHDEIVIDMASSPRPTLYMVGLGASQYMDSAYNLKYAAKDVKDVERFLKTASSYTSVKTLFLQNEEVNKSSLEKISGFLANSAPEDMLLVYYAGHGLLDVQFNYFLAAYDIDFNQPARKGIAVEDLEKVLSKAKGRKKILIIDACHSGLLENQEDITVSVSAENKNISATGRGIIVLKDENKQVDAEVLQGAFMTINKGDGITIIAASGGAELAYEDPQYQNGLFTYSLLDGIKSGHADLDADKTIYLSELKTYIEKKVVTLSSGKQRPTNRRWNNYFDFAIWSLQDRAVNKFFKTITSDDTTAFRQMLDEGYDLGMTDDETGMTALHIAARDNAVNVLRIILQAKPSLNPLSRFGWTPLFLSVKNNNNAAAYLLITAGAKVQGENFYAGTNEKKSLLQLAVENNNSQLVDMLDKADLYKKNDTLYRQMINAIYRGDREKLQKLLANSAPDINFVLPDAGVSLVYFAVNSGNTGITKLLLEKGAAIGKIKYTTFTPLHLAAWLGNEAITRLLLEAGADKSLVDATGKRPMDYLQSDNSQLKSLLK